MCKENSRYICNSNNLGIHVCDLEQKYFGKPFKNKTAILGNCSSSSIILYEGEVTEEEEGSLLRLCRAGWRIDGLSVEAGAERG